MITIEATGLVYRNPKPYLRAIHAWHPSPVRLDNGTLVVSFDLGQAVEGLDYRTYLSRSMDEGVHWTPPLPLMNDPTPRRASHTVRLGRTADGTLVAMGARMYRDDPEEGLLNRANLGYTEMDVVQLTSSDGGLTWDGPHTVRPPLVGPAFETCHAIVELSDGRWLWPTSTWKGWAGQAPNGMKAIAFVSHDRGKTWPDYLDVMDGYARGIIYWEQSLVALPDGRLLAAAWAFDEPKGVTQGVHYAVSRDGSTFSSPRDTGLPGETTKLLSLGDGRVFCVYRGTGPSGLWGAIARLDRDQWVTLESTSLWGAPASGLFGRGASEDELSNLKFGYPQPVRLPNGDIFLAFWCCEDNVHNIRWLRIRLDRKGNGMKKRARATPSEIRTRLTGRVTSIPTPFTADGNIQRDGVAGIIETGLDGGSSVVLLTAGDSQYSFMTGEEIAALTRFVIERIAGRALFVAATGPWATRRSVAFAEMCRDMGADVLMSLPAAQITTGSGLVAHYKALAAVMPVMLVGNPSFQVLEQLLDEPAICCFKEDGTEAYAVELLQRYGRHWTVMTGGGLHRHLIEWPFGACVFMDWSTAFAPNIGEEYWQSLQHGDTAAAARITEEIERPLFDLAAALDPAHGWQMLWHAALEIVGIAPRYLRLPQPSATDEQMERVRDLLKHLKICGPRA